MLIVQTADPFPDKYKAWEGRLDSFAEVQVKYAKAALESSRYMGEKIIETLQGMIVVNHHNT